MNMKRWNSMLLVAGLIIVSILLSGLIMRGCSPPTIITHKESIGLLYGQICGPAIKYSWPWSRTYHSEKYRQLVTTFSEVPRMVFPVKLDSKKIDVENINKELLFFLFEHAYSTNSRDVIVGLVTKPENNLSVGNEVILSSKFIYKPFWRDPPIWLEQAETEGQITDDIPH